MSNVCHLLLFTYLRADHPLYLLEPRSAFVSTPPSGDHPSAEGEVGEREESQLTTQ